MVKTRCGPKNSWNNEYFFEERANNDFKLEGSFCMLSSKEEFCQNFEKLCWQKGEIKIRFVQAMLWFP